MLHLILESKLLGGFSLDALTLAITRGQTTQGPQWIAEMCGECCKSLGGRKHCKTSHLLAALKQAGTVRQQSNGSA